MSKMKSTQKWYWGVEGDGNGYDYVDGTLDLNANELPWIDDTIEIDINAGDTATLTIAKKYMRNWATVLKVGRNFITCINTDPNIPWSDPLKIVFRGVITKLNPKHQEHLTIKGDSRLAVWAKQALNTLHNSTSTKPSDGITFSGLTYQTLMCNIARHATNVALFPAGQRTANVMGSFSGGTTGDTYKYVAKYQDFTTVADAMIEHRDSLSANGNEFRFNPVFTSSAMNRIVENFVVGDDSKAGAHINESQTVTINIATADDYNKMIEMSAVWDLDGVATRWIGNSKLGDEEKDDGSDVTTKANTSTGLPRYDAFFNPGVELTPAQMSEGLQSRLDSSAEFAEATYSVEEDFDTKWKNHLGKMINFVGAAGTEYADFNMTLRCISLSFTSKTGSVRIGLMVKQPRYPNLPNDRKRGGPKAGPNNKNKGGGGGTGGKGTGTDKPIKPKKKPNDKDKPVIPGFDSDDWDKKPGTDTPPPFVIPVDGSYWEWSKLDGIRSFWTSSIEGHTAIPDDYNGRWLGMSHAHMATMWPDKESRGELQNLNVSKSKKLNTRPTVSNFTEWVNDLPSSASLGLTGERGDIMNIDWIMIEPHALSGTLSGYGLKYEIFNYTLTLQGKKAARIAMVTLHQLQFFEGDSDNRLRSKDFSFKVSLDGNLDPIGPVVATDESPYQGNSIYDTDWTFYAFGQQIDSDTSGDIEKTVILTPRAYPKDQTFPKPGLTGYDNDYWASINQGAYATWNIAMVKNWNNGSNDASGGPSILGENYREMTWLDISWVDQSQIMNNTFACNVLGNSVYASSMTAYGRDIEAKTGNDYPAGEFLIARADFQSKPNKGLSSWAKLHSGVLPSHAGSNHEQFMMFASTWKRSRDEIGFHQGDDYWDSKIFVKNGAQSARTLEEPVFWFTDRSFVTKGVMPYQKDGFTDLFDFSVGTNNTQGRKWVNPGGVSNHAVLLWGYNLQYTTTNKTMRRDNFTVNLGTTVNAPAYGWNSTGAGNIWWTWEL